MTAVLGISVGASAVRFARRDSGKADNPVLRSQPLAALLGKPEDTVAKSLETALTDTAEIEQVHAIGVAYRNDAQAGAARTALDRLDIEFRLVPEVTAALRMLETAGMLGTHETLVFYDLGSSGLTVTVVDRNTGAVLSSARTDRISGDAVDLLVLEHQLDQHRFPRPGDAAAHLALSTRCREAKEELSTKGAVCIPGDGGVLLLTQDNFASLIDEPVKESARLARDVIRRSGRRPDAAVLIGGGANIPLVASAMQSWLAIPVIVPEQPELVAAQGAALLAHPAPAAPPAPPAPTEVIETITTTVGASTSPEPPTPPRKRRGVVLAAGIVTVVAALGLGANLMSGSEEVQPVVTQQDTQQQEAPPPPATPEEPAPAPEPAPPVADQEPAAPAPAEEPATYEPQPQVPAPVVAGAPSVATAEAVPPAPEPEPAPLIPGLPQFELPTLPPPPTIPLPELPRIPGL